MKPNNKPSRRRSLPSAWTRAKACGIDISLLKANLRLTVAERLLRHDAALRSMLSLRDAVKDAKKAMNRPRDQEAILQLEALRERED